MSDKNSRITATIDLDAPGYRTGVLKIPYSHNRSAYGHIPVPVAVVSRGEGPTLLLTGGVHGDEYEGPVALMKLLGRLPDLQVNGRIIVVPAINLPAFLAGTRNSPIDAGNLNRLFPGKRDGGITEMIAHFIETELLPRADVAFDFHAGGASFHHLPTMLAAPPRDPARRADYLKLVEAVGAPVTMVMDLLGEDRTFAAAAERRGIPFLCGEFGGAASCNPDNLALVEAGLDRVLATLGIVSGQPLTPPGATRFMKVEGAQHYLYAPRAGIHEPCFRLGDEVEAGQLAVRLFDPHAPHLPPIELRFAAAGKVVCARTFAAVEPGDCIALCASDHVWS
ncbi:succinylglutamate desuccinylase/aspartoacylase family protein [Xanthobacter autotrophicus DSM 431]|uniref:succinylglutamate desuccinylase/aspartoacylase family protein n=1 Tax=Xanthobacter nonsaccharivorans TaxID=3119912 RepID=UPI003728201B